MSSISQSVSDAERQKNIFANCFWGKDDAGYDVLTTRLKQSKQTCEEVKNLFHERALIEEEYAKRLSKLSKIPVGKDEIGSLHDALETVRQELEATAKEHIGLSQKIRAELEQDLADFIAKQREKRKLQQNVVEASLRNKQTQVSFAQKAREKYESECLKLPGLFESKKTAMGKEMEKLNSKIEKTQLAAKAADQEYMQTVKIAADATQKWNEEWKLACEVSIQSIMNITGMYITDEGWNRF